MTQVAIKEVTVLARLEIKADPRKVVYTVLSSDGVSKYETSLFDGKACSCSCVSRRPCYHMIGCEALEASRMVPATYTDEQLEDMAWEEEDRLYRIESGLSARLTREQFAEEFSIYNI
jgi:hypothetical protein